MLGAIRLQKRNVALRAFFVLIPSPGLFGLLAFCTRGTVFKMAPSSDPHMARMGRITFYIRELRIFFGYGHGSMIFFGVLPDSQ